MYPSNQGVRRGGRDLARLSIRFGAVLTAFAATFGVGAFGVAAERDATGSISVEIRNVRVEKTATSHRFVHDRAFVESGGVGVTLTQGQVCFGSGVCTGKPVKYRVEADKEFVLRNAVVEPLGAKETFAYTYSGKDDNGHAVFVLFRIEVSGEDYEVTP